MSTAFTGLSLKTSYTSNNTEDICSQRKSAYQSFKIKSLNHILPCDDVLVKHYPLLYPKMAFLSLYVHDMLDTNEPILIGLIETYTTNLRTHKFIPDTRPAEPSRPHTILFTQILVDQKKLISSSKNIRKSLINNTVTLYKS
ncbi:hypothetical protein RIR_jg11132.t1 [Rhizophagus irregularis DAOM 181602=DAOM 197198]|uniref:Uncharacterized protein n=1 Tax=Rhizophagus irregularis (strain DAOM 181602 / DAOM 197198 / MUCL 43194) TaxID=747089 RepID=U9U7B2_RHIID|nr:hypothetical protein RIR_jg11132.t1 [Rhizophagus irregularis DAOM 181602=DAOM 197198]